MEQLTEDIIKKVVLRFLRRHYKFRLRYEDQPVLAKYDLEGVGGIIADGYYSFKKTDGKPFTATFEATSKASKDEVIYKPQQKILFWDGVVVASIFTVFLASLNLRQRFQPLDNTLIIERIALVMVVMGVVFTIFYLLAKNFRRYRYIYAIEQFKKYYADEQWIALASDVFTSGEDHYLRELKNQCVHNGFGLLTVDEKLDTKIIITPSRHDIFLGKRKSVAFLPQTKMQEQLKKGRFGKYWGLFGEKIPGFLKKDTSILRYRKTYYYQMLIITGCVVFLGVIFSKEMENPDFKAVSKEQFKGEIARSRSNNLPEQEAFLGDSASTPAVKGKTRQDESFWQLEKEETEPDTSGELPPSFAENTPSGEDEFTSKGLEGYLIYDCSRFFNFNGKKYIIQVATYTSWDKTRKKLDFLRNEGIESMALLLSCFSKSEIGYAVHAGMIYNSAAEARKELAAFRQKYGAELKEIQGWKIREIEPVME